MPLPLTPPLYIDPVTQTRYDLDPPRWCSSTGGPLMLTPLAGITRADVLSDCPSLWRYQAAFPVTVAEPVTLGEGRTPLVAAEYAGRPCRFKLEWFSPTGSFKDRGTSVMISILKRQGVQAVLEDSSGNGGASVAAYGAAAGMAVTVFVPAATQPAKIAQIRAYGAEIVLVPGPREAAETAAIDRASSVFYASHNWQPFFLQGTKTLGYEVWEDLGFRVPDNIVLPGGAGSNLLGCHMAFKELMACGEIRRLPRLFLSQPANCAPVHGSFQAGVDEPVALEFKPTVAEGTAIKRPLRLRQMLQALRETDGGTVTVEEDAIVDASLRLARQGFYVEPTCAHAAAGFAKLVALGRIDKEEETVVLLTGTGLKSTEFYASRF